MKNTQTWQRKSLTLSQYVKFLNGVPLGDSKPLSNMLRRSLGAASFVEFWQYWNPIWGYALGKYVYAPAQQILPRSVAFVITFIVSGSIHDLVTMLVRRAFAFFFTPWFFLLGLGAVLSQALGVNFSKLPLWQRVAVNLLYLVTCLILTLFFKKELMI
jgi:hypothetical protein